MKKFKKMAFAVVAIAAVGLGSYKAYGSYTAANMSEEDLLMAENIEAMAIGGENDNRDDEYVDIKGKEIQKCWRRHYTGSTIACDTKFSNGKYCDGRRRIFKYGPEYKIVYESAGAVKKSYAYDHRLSILNESDTHCAHEDSQITSPNATEPTIKESVENCPKCY